MSSENQAKIWPTKLHEPVYLDCQVSTKHSIPCVELWLGMDRMALLDYSELTSLIDLLCARQERLREMLNGR